MIPTSVVNIVDMRVGANNTDIALNPLAVIITDMRWEKGSALSGVEVEKRRSWIAIRVITLV